MKNTSVLTWVGIGIVVVLLVWGFVSSRPQPFVLKEMPITLADPSGLPGLRESEAPWDRGLEGLGERLAANKLPELATEGQVLHIHQHLDIFIKGQSVAVPANIGINERGGWLSPIHTHDTRGVIHVESPFEAAFTLGQFFDIWGVRLTERAIGGYEADAENTLRVYVNGERYEGNPRELVLGTRQQIAIVYGSDAETPNPIPSSYTFKPGE